MNDSSDDANVIQTLIERLSNQRLPRVLDMKDKVDTGEKLGDYDIQFLKNVFSDAQNVKPLVDRHPEYQELAIRVIHLYKEIMDKAMENEKNA